MNTSVKPFHILLNGAIAIILLLFYFICMLMFDTGEFTNVNFFIFLCSLILVEVALFSMEKKGIKAYNVFILIYFFCLLLNTYNLSELQVKKTWMDFYLFFGGALIFSVMLYLPENVNKYKLSNVKLEILSPESVTIMLLAIFIFLKMIIYSRVGITFLSDIPLHKRQNLSVSGFSGLSALMGWLLLIMIPHIKNYMKVIVAANLLLFMGILDYSRGTMMRIILFLVLYYCYEKKEKLFTEKTIAILLVVVLLLLSLFTIMGEKRETDDGKEWSTIAVLTQLKINSTAIGWIYGYTALNFDVLKFYSKASISNPSNEPDEIMTPVTRVLDPEKYIARIEGTKKVALGNIFNASTIFSGFVRDFGILYIIEVLIFSMFIALLILLANMREMKGTYVFILMQTSLTMFGNYYVAIPPIFLAMIASYVIFLFVRKPQENLVEKSLYCNRYNKV